MFLKNVKFKLNLFLKRALDIIVSLLGLFILSPIILIVSLIIKLDSPGPVLIKQKRVGINNKIFVMYKFRTMKIGTPEVAKEILLKNGLDSYLTRVGRFLRKTLIDEVPQLINVLTGDMSFNKVPAWAQVASAISSFGIIYQKKGVAHVPIPPIKC